MKKAVVLTLFLIIAAFADTTFAQSTAALDKGEIFVELEDIAGSDFPKMKVTGVIEAPPSKVYQIITDCDRFPERMPRVESAKTLKKSKSSHTCEVTIGLPFPLADLTAVTKDRRKAGPDEWYRKWELVEEIESSYHANSGSFVLTPFEGDPNRTLVRYSVHAIPKTAVPDFLRKSAQKKSLPDLIERLRLEVRKI